MDKVEIPEIEVVFVNSKKEIVSTLIFDPGKQEWKEPEAGGVDEDGVFLRVWSQD